MLKNPLGEIEPMVDELPHDEDIDTDGSDLHRAALSQGITPRKPGPSIPMTPEQEREYDEQCEQYDRALNARLGIKT